MSGLCLLALSFVFGGTGCGAEELFYQEIPSVSAAEMDFDTTEITERFVRGDKSRNTEGSGLGLAIVKSFTELQGGTFEILVDGDLFKAVVVFWK